MVVKLPSGLYFELLKYAREQHISVQQLALELIRYGLSENKIFVCLHDKEFRKFSRKAKQWYCSNCWTFIDLVAIKGGFKDEYRLPSWEIKKEMSVQEWSKMQEPQNDDLK